MLASRQHNRLLKQMDFWRVVLDESQRIKSNRAVVTTHACQLKRQHSWYTPLNCTC
jgi:SNF2 family DNA or RNA helicase